jgi:prepilin-type N-terminal cleavage/methylation domain-containing protein
MSAPDRGGFTLVEHLVGLTIASLVLLLAFQAIHAHGRYARAQSERVHLQQHARAAVELISSELRVADPMSIVEATRTSIRFAVPRAWGVVCAHSESRLSVLFPPTVVQVADPPQEWLAIPPVGPSAGWLHLPVADLTASATERAAAAAACGGLGAGFVPGGGPGSEARMYGPRVDQGIGGTLGIGPAEPGLEPGRALYLFDRVRYELAASSAGPGLWVRRNSGPALQMHPFAGPVGPAGLRFTYFAEDRSELTPPLGPEPLRQIRIVEVLVAPERPGEPPAHSPQAAAVRVFLRNAQ